MIGTETTHLPPRVGEMRFIQCDASKAESILGWKAKKRFEEGIKELLQRKAN